MQAAIIWSGINPVASGDLGDPDAYLQLVKSARIVESGDWYDNVLPRSNWPHGDVTTWTRSLDGILLTGAALLAPCFGFRDALYWVGAAFSPACLLISALAAGWMARPLLSPPGCFGASLLLLAQPGLLSYAAASPNHHSLLFLAFLATCGLALRALDNPDARRPAMLAGIAAAFGLWTSVEFLLPLAVLTTIFGVVWLVRGDRWLPANRSFTFGFLIALAIFLPIERSPFGDMLAPEYDRLSAVHVVLAVILCLFWIAVPPVARRLGTKSGSRLAAGTVGIVAAAGCMFAVFPKFFGGPLVDVNPALIPFLVTNNADWQPVLPHGLGGTASFLIYLGQPLLCLGWMIRKLQARHGNANWPSWLLLTALLAAYIAMTIHAIRFAGYAEILCLIPLIDLVEHVHWRLGGRQKWHTALTRAASAAALIVGIPVAGGFLLTAAGSTISHSAGGTCHLADIAPVLNDPSGLGSRQRLILAEIHGGSEILYRTRHAVLATPMFHNLGILDAYHILSAAEDDDAYSTIEARHVDLILLCPGSGERSVFASDHGENTLYNRLTGGHLPGWAKAVPLPASARNYLLFVVQS